MRKNRAFFAASFCGGRGIEIGALHEPMPLPPESRVRYVDRLSVADLRNQYPELNDRDLVPVDIVDSGETLASLPDGLEDFVIAAQFIEHCRNPVRALANMLRVVRNQGFVLLTVPDKRYTFDKHRPITTHEHLLDECLNGTEHTLRGHFHDFLKTPDQEEGETLEGSVDALMARDYSIHYHVWDSDAFLQFLLFAKERFTLPFEIWVSFRNGEELIVVLRKMLMPPG
jgi:SAM-dependent methyltransferase